MSYTIPLLCDKRRRNFMIYKYYRCLDIVFIGNEKATR